MSITIQTQQVPDMGFLVLMMGFFTSFVTFVQLGWMWSVSIGMKHLLPNNAGLNDLWFKLCLLAIVLYQLYNLYVVYDMFSAFSELSAGRNPAGFLLKIISFQRYSLVLLPLSLFILFCHCYLFYFSAKTLRTIELNRVTDVGDYIGSFFLFMFNIVGFWIIQPKVNRIMLGNWTPPPPPYIRTMLTPPSIQ